MMTLLAITVFDRLGLGVLAAMLALVAFVCWMFLLLFLGKLWRRLIRPKRQHIMNIMIGVMLLISLAILFAVPSRGFELEESGAEQRYSTLHKFGITAWFVERQTNVFSPSASRPTSVAWQTSTEFSVLGILAALPTVAMMLLLGRWLSRELPRFYRLPDDHCDECGYNMTGIHSPVCPECGEPIG